ncbi:unnamed protein product [Clonostachys solani]|uniref:Protein kinase domain-containing protein n=1 Tax=Clonostachys solani TaxID=160281 RepID=A0A9P0ECU9_9HYPO|nr:unnamed protein product [Clonostachys solani]
MSDQHHCEYCLRQQFAAQQEAEEQRRLEEQAEEQYERPEVPYQKGLVLQVRAHIPFEPFGNPGYATTFKSRGDEAASTHGQADWCMKHPYPETEPHPDQSVFNLHLLDEVAVRDGRGAQLLRCEWEGQESRGKPLVAKIFDPMYYARDEVGKDVTFIAASDYSCEAASYEDLQKAGVDGVMTPKYYGSWTFDLPIAQDGTRQVHMVIIEWIDAPTMLSYCEERRIHHIPPQRRLDILAQVFETRAKLAFHGAESLDLAMRNVLILGDLENDPTPPRVIFIDFNDSLARNRPNSLYQVAWEKPPNPMCLYWNKRSAEEFNSWIPEPHLSDMDAFNKWVKSIWGDSDEFCVSSDFDDILETGSYAALGDSPPPSPLPDTEYWDIDEEEWLPTSDAAKTDPGEWPPFIPDTEFESDESCSGSEDSSDETMSNAAC